jgi:hypothetical protein
MSGAKIILLIAGAIALIAGLALTSYQMMLSLPAPGEMHGAKLGPSNLSLETHFPGIIVMGIGAILLIVAAMTGRKSN